MLEFAKENPLVALLITYAVCRTVRSVSYVYIAHKYPIPEPAVVEAPPEATLAPVGA